MLTIFLKEILNFVRASRVRVRVRVRHENFGKRNVVEGFLFSEKEN